MDAGGRMKVVKNTRSATNISFMPLLVIVKVISFPLIILPTVCTFWSFWSTPEKQSPINAQLVLLQIRREIWTLIWSKWVKRAIKRSNLVTSSLGSHIVVTARRHFVAKGSQQFFLVLNGQTHRLVPLGLPSGFNKKEDTGQEKTMH